MGLKTLINILSSGKFGTGVLSYFVFLRWLFFLNILIFLLVLLFIFVPQMIHERSTDTANPSDFNGKNLLDGAVGIYCIKTNYNKIPCLSINFFPGLV